jgi:hypothetical protein
MQFKMARVNRIFQKIVNIPFEIPPIRQAQMFRLLTGRINSAIANDVADYD